VYLPRGYPQTGLSFRPTVINHGLWSGIPDLDAETQLETPPPYEYSKGRYEYIPYGSYYPMSGMNVAFGREMVPAMYFGLMGHHLYMDSDWGYHRYGDIWAGILSKRIADHLGYAVRTGSPWVEHERASDPHVNKLKEGTAKAANEWFWQRVDAVKLTKSTVKEAYHELWDKIELPDLYYWRALRRASHTWADLF
jgi:reversibly glycosylated polypeptide / UDP-arabinopyranose mutase